MDSTDIDNPKTWLHFAFTKNLLQAFEQCEDGKCEEMSEELKIVIIVSVVSVVAVALILIALCLGIKLYKRR
jgi:hypothetical protein